VGRLGRPEEVAEAVAFFVGEQSGYTTGQVLVVSGGY
jgi:NAD(P)-dependent dehydrogenase (short-subunit alcohol dehydrogenase family)